MKKVINCLFLPLIEILNKKEMLMKMLTAIIKPF
ncbi:MAG: hypothetical protein ACI8UC_001806, partial [Psychromonas sp.]